jgi:hypothetical protein
MTNRLIGQHQAGLHIEQMAGMYGYALRRLGRSSETEQHGDERNSVGSPISLLH